MEHITGTSMLVALRKWDPILRDRTLASNIIYTYCALAFLGWDKLWAHENKFPIK